MSLTDEQINLLDFDSSQTFDNEQKSLLTNHLDSSTGATTVTTNAHIVPSTQHLQHQHSITASVPHQPQLTTTMQISPELIEQSKSSLEVRRFVQFSQFQCSSASSSDEYSSRIQSENTNAESQWKSSRR